jgi:GxxExxY protein
LAALTDSIIAAAVEVHRALGPGFVEQIYENALVVELASRGHTVERQVGFDVTYRSQLVGHHRADILVDGQIILELKSVEALGAVHAAQLRSTLKAAGKHVGLVLNFNQDTLVQGIKRVIA